MDTLTHDPAEAGGQNTGPEEENRNLEEAFEKLESLAALLEDKNTPLEKAFSYYEQGMKLLKVCSEKLDTVEKKMLQLGEDGSYHEF